MDSISLADQDVAERTPVSDGEWVADDSRPPARRRRRWRTLALVGVLATLAAAGGDRIWRSSEPPAAPPPPPPQVTVSLPLRQAKLQAQPARFLGQFSAVDSVELRAQVGGTLTAIEFQDGQVVHKGDPLFVIDPRPFQIRLDQAVAQLQTAQAKESAEGEAEVSGRRSSSSGPISARRKAWTSAPPISAQPAGRHRHRQGGDHGRAARPGLLACHRAVHRADRRCASRVRRQPGERQPGRHEPDDADGDDRFAGPNPSRFRHERRRITWPIRQAHHGGAPHDDVDISLSGDGHFDRHGYARLR